MVISGYTLDIRVNGIGNGITCAHCSCTIVQKQYVVINGYTWLSVVIRCYQWLSMVISGYTIDIRVNGIGNGITCAHCSCTIVQKQYVVINGYTWLSVVIRGYQWLSMVIHGYQWL